MTASDLEIKAEVWCAIIVFLPSHFHCAVCPTANEERNMRKIPCKIIRKKEKCIDVYI